MNIHVLRGDCMLPNVRGVDDTKAILDENRFVDCLSEIELSRIQTATLSIGSFGFFLLRTYT